MWGGEGWQELVKAVCLVWNEVLSPAQLYTDEGESGVCGSVQALPLSKNSSWRVLIKYSPTILMFSAKWRGASRSCFIIQLGPFL